MPLLYRLIVVGVLVAPLPVMAVHSVILALVFPIATVLGREITPVGAVFAVVPVVVLAAVPIVDADLHAGLLRLWSGHGCRRCGKGST